jgi:hypothetical protein
MLAEEWERKAERAERAPWLRTSVTQDPAPSDKPKESGN